MRGSLRKVQVNLRAFAALIGIAVFCHSTPVRADLRANVDCVAGILDLPSPSRLPTVHIMPKSILTESVPRGWTRKEWEKSAGGLFYGFGNGLIYLHPGSTVRAKAHELAHFILWSNGEPWKHGAGQVDRQIEKVVRAYPEKCF